MTANIHAGVPHAIALPGTSPVYEDGTEYKQVDPYNDLTAPGIGSDPGWPGVLQRPREHHVDEGNGVNVAPSSWQVATDIDRTVGGRPGMINRLPYTTGVVSNIAMENYELTGKSLRVRRQPENQWGPVQGGKSGPSEFGAAIAQQAIPDVPDWVAQSGITEVY